MNKAMMAVILMAVAGTVHAGDFTLDGVKAGEVRGVAFEMSAPAAERVYTSAQTAITKAEREYLLRTDVRASGLAWQLMANDGVQDPQLTPKVFASYYRKAASKMAAKPEAGAPSPAATEAAVALLKKYCEIYDAAAKKARTLDEFQALTDGSVTELYNVAGKARTYGELFNGVAAVSAELRLAQAEKSVGGERSSAVQRLESRHAHYNAPIAMMDAEYAMKNLRNAGAKVADFKVKNMGDDGMVVFEVSFVSDRKLKVSRSPVVGYSEGFDLMRRTKDEHTRLGRTVIYHELVPTSNDWQSVKGWRVHVYYLEAAAR